MSTEIGARLVAASATLPSKKREIPHLTASAPARAREALRAPLDVMAGDPDPRLIEHRRLRAQFGADRAGEQPRHRVDDADHRRASTAWRSEARDEGHATARVGEPSSGARPQSASAPR